jgi:hypothetical protein
MHREGETDLGMAGRHVAKAREIVANQRRRIEKLRAVGASTFDAEQTLRIFEANLRLFEEHEREWRAKSGK